MKIQKKDGNISSPGTERAKKEPYLLSLKYLCIALIIIVSSGIYINTLSNGFVYDDLVQVLKNPWIKDVRNIKEIFFSNTWAFANPSLGSRSSNFYRPMMHLVYMLNYYIFGLNPFGFHLTNIILHSLVAVLLFLIASFIFREVHFPRSLFVPLVASLLFAVHPIHTEAVAWIGGLPELSFTFFYLLSFYLYLTKYRAKKLKLILSAIFFLFAAISKETALTLPILMLIYDFSLGKNQKNRVLDYKLAIKNMVKTYLPYIAVLGIYFVLRLNALGGFMPQKRHEELGTHDYFINIFPLLMTYIRKLFFPVNLNPYYMLNPISSIIEWKGIIPLVFTLIFLLLCFIARNRNRILFFNLFWIIVPLLPVLYIPAVGENTFAERYLYLPSFGFVTLIALSLEEVRIKSRSGSIMVILFFSSLIGLYSAVTLSRNIVWKDNYSLWSDTVKKTPLNSKAHEYLAYSLYGRGKIDNAIEEYCAALKLDPGNADAHINLGIAYTARGLRGKAVEEYESAIKYKPDFAKAHFNLANAYWDLGLEDKAIEHNLIAKRLMPKSAEVYNNLGILYAQKGLTNEAISYFQSAISLCPDKAIFHDNLSKAYESEKLIDKAEEERHKAMMLQK